jgi:hypothetical protein
MPVRVIQSWHQKWKEFNLSHRSHVIGFPRSLCVNHKPFPGLQWVLSSIAELAGGCVGRACGRSASRSRWNRIVLEKRETPLLFPRRTRLWSTSPGWLFLVIMIVV